MKTVDSVGILPLASRTGAQQWPVLPQNGVNYAAQTIPDKNNLCWRGVKVYINRPASPGSGSITVTINEYDSFGNKNALLTSVALTGAGLTVLTVYPTVPAVANVSAQANLGASFSVNIADNNGSQLNYSASMVLLP